MINQSYLSKTNKLFKLVHSNEMAYYNNQEKELNYDQNYFHSANEIFLSMGFGKLKIVFI
jgi:hypothetical protein